MSDFIFKRLGFLAVALFATQVSAQDGSQIAQKRADGEEINNGTNPTLLTTQAIAQYQYNDLRFGGDTGLLELQYVQPFGDGNRAFRFTVPFADNSLNSSYGIGDISITYIDVFYLTKENGSAFTAELFLDTASRDGNGYGQLAMETQIFYAFFLDNGSIFAPAWVQTFGLEGGNDNGGKLNVSTFDFYFVPKLPDPQYYMTVDPAVIHDWENDKTFGSLQVTFGMLTGRVFGGDSQVFIKPGIQIGNDRPFDWSVQVGYKVMNF